MSSAVAARSGPAAGPRRRAPDEKRVAICAAAADLFAERGFAATTTARIAARAGVSEGIVFHHFGSKRDLFGVVVSDYGRDFVRAMFGDDPHAHPVSAADAIRAGFDYVREHRALHGAFAVRDPALADLVDGATHDAIVVALEATLRGALDRGIARPMDPRIVAELCYGLVDAALRACFQAGAVVDEERYLRETIRSVERVVAGPNPVRADETSTDHERVAIRDPKRSPS